MAAKAQNIIKSLLDWYDRHARDLPWRMRPGQKADPYRIWLSEIMLQQTTVPAVMPYFQKFTQLYPTVQALAEAPSEDIMRHWAGLGYYSRARNLHACAKAVVANHKGVFPRKTADLKCLPGIGDYTAGAVSAIAYGEKASVVDSNVERVITRVFAIETPMPAAKPEIRKQAEVIYMNEANIRPSDLPQAFMDLGATICTPTKPKCPICPINKSCEAFKQGIQEQLPRRSKDKQRPERVGLVYWITDGKGNVLLERREAKGLLGGMAGLPTGEWIDHKHQAPALTLKGLKAGQPMKETVRHVFTHFGLTMTIIPANMKTAPEGFYWVKEKEIGDAGLPSVFGKVVKLLMKTAG